MKREKHDPVILHREEIDCLSTFYEIIMHVIILQRRTSEFHELNITVRGREKVSIIIKNIESISYTVSSSIL